MRHNLLRAAHLLHTIGSFAADSLANWRDIRREIEPHLQRFWAENDGSISENDLRRVRYYLQIGPPGLGYIFASLRGKPLAKRERKAQLWLMALTPIFDEYFDKPETYSLTRLREILHTPEALTPSNTHEAMTLFFWRSAWALLPEREKLLATIDAIFSAQLRGNQQRDASLTYADVRQITCEKGGYAAVLFRLLLENPPSEAEQDALFHLGAITQFADDFFDVYEDAQANIRTIATLSADLQPVKADYLAYMQSTKEKVFRLPYSQPQLRLFWDKYLFIFVRGQVAIEQLCALQAASGGTFIPAHHPRKALITDMEKLHNIRSAWRLFRG